MVNFGKLQIVLENFDKFGWFQQIFVNLKKCQGKFFQTFKNEVDCRNSD